MTASATPVADVAKALSRGAVTHRLCRGVASGVGVAPGALPHPRAKDRGADANVSCAARNRDLVVAAHAHR